MMQSREDSSPPPTVPVLEDWLAWKSRCARALCTKDTQRRLGYFALYRFGIQLRRQLATTNLRPEDAVRQHPTEEDAWHRFESFAALTQTRQGKRYKDWIFARIQQSNRSALDTIQSGATLILRSAVRDYLRGEYAPHRAASLDQPVGDGTLTLGDLLPGLVSTEDDATTREYNTLAEGHAHRVFEGLSRRERVGLLARLMGVALDHDDVLVAADCGKSTLNQAVKNLWVHMRESLLREYREDGHDAIMALATLVIQHLERITFLWKLSEKNLPRCFYSTEDA
jgi:hypothetical protein